MITPVKTCRICGNPDLVPVIDLGNFVLTGVFPRDKHQALMQGPLRVVKCRENKPEHCGLLQLAHVYDVTALYGDHYGYRSALNSSMVAHLKGIISKSLKKVNLSARDIVLDIGSNDGTLLKSFENKDLQLVGIDPAGNKFSKCYPSYIKNIPGFFSAQLFKQHFGVAQAKLVTSIAMVYDLQSPVKFMREIHAILKDDGIWVFEQSYMPEMLNKLAYDTICQEHASYYALKQIKWMTDQVGFKIIEVEFNASNGGSFLVMVAKKSNTALKEKITRIKEILTNEKKQGLSSLKPYKKFQQKINKHRVDLIRFLGKLKSKGKTVFGYGASTKGNVILQFCSLTSKDIPLIAEINRDKFRCFTPGTHIPIKAEAVARKLNPDYFLVLPWHFRKNIIEREKDFLRAGGKLVFPLPKIKVVGGK